MFTKNFFIGLAIVAGIIIVIIAIIVLGRKYGGWFGGETARPYPYCNCRRHADCGRDGYCDGCRCEANPDPNRNIYVSPIIYTPAPNPTPNPPPPPPPPPPAEITV